MQKIIETLISPIRVVSLKDIETNEDEENNLGEGGYNKIRRGYWKDMKMEVALKISKSDCFDKELIRQLRVLSISHHDNILPLMGLIIEEHKNSFFLDKNNFF